MKALEAKVAEDGFILIADHVLDEVPQPPGPARVFFPTRPDDSPASTRRPSKTIVCLDKKIIIGAGNA